MTETGPINVCQVSCLTHGADLINALLSSGATLPSSGEVVMHYSQLTPQGFSVATPNEGRRLLFHRRDIVSK